ncbi:class I SAM-dependent methyltransferase [Pelagibacterales bacterium SAG-MED35]|nr:class I SAM-dependent methyltransferase [Pelagibacterales bacterium SAG-MED35]
MDCGSGLGFIARELEKVKNFDVYAADPSKSVNKITKKLYPNSKFIHCEIKTIPKKYNLHFDIIYLREVYPFTRTDDFKLHKKLLSILLKKLKKKGILIFEQIKNQNDIINNLDRLNYNYQIHYLLPIKLNKFDYLNIFFSKFKILQYFILLVYKISGKKVNHLIIIKKGADL